MKCGKRLVLWTLFACNLVEQRAPEVRLRGGGEVGGLVSADGSYLLYPGIPYATVRARFQAPGPAPRWEGTLRGDQLTVCAQPGPLGTFGVEDCLRLHVYVPARAFHARRAPLPVMVFVHGGAFVIGSGGSFIYGPDFFMKKDVILVTFNYRLGAFGFTCLGVPEAPGNAGLKDQLAALEWVQENIAAFGGDPGAVTLFGESAGAVSASLLLAGGKTRGLVHRAILQSGSGLASWALDRHPLQTASLVAARLGYVSDDPHDLYRFLSTVDYRDLAVITHGRPDDLFFDTQLLHLPCVEEQIEGERAAVSDLPWNSLVRNDDHVPVILGTNSQEGMIITASANGSVEERNGKLILASDLYFSSEREAMEVSQRAQHYYFGSNRISMDKINNVTELYTHLYFEVPMILESELMLNGSAAPVFNYIFEYSGGRNLVKWRSARGGEVGACHGDELFYMFSSALLPLRPSAADRRLIELLTTLWSEFAWHGRPAARGVRWPPSERGALRFLYIGERPRLGGAPDPRALALWRDIYVRHRKSSPRQPSLPL